MRETHTRAKVVNSPLPYPALPKYPPVVRSIAPTFRVKRLPQLVFGCALLFSGCAGKGGLTLTTVQESSQKPSNVALYFRVDTDEGEPLPGLESEQFNIYEDDKLVSTYESKQTILNPEVAAAHYTLLLVDMSGSVAESDQAGAVVEAAALFSQKVEENNRVAIYAFDGSEELYKISGFTDNAAKANSRVEKLAGFKPKDPSTNLNGAVVMALAELDGALQKEELPLRFGTLVVFTDGTDRAARVPQADMLTAVSESKYSVFAIGLGAEIDEEELDGIGRDGTAMATDKDAVLDAFNAVAERVEKKTRSYYLLSYCSPARAQEHVVRIEAVTTSTNKKGKEKEARGELTTGFDATGFEPDCDPNTPPEFDITQGEAVRAEQDSAPPKKKKWKLFGGEGKASASGEAQASTEDE